MAVFLYFELQDEMRSQLKTRHFFVESPILCHNYVRVGGMRIWKEL
jgi:hypothetical protein